MIEPGLYYWDDKKRNEPHILIEFIAYSRTDPRFCLVRFPIDESRHRIDVVVFEALAIKLSPLELLAMCAE